MPDTPIEMMDDPWQHSIKWLAAAYWSKVWMRQAFIKVIN